MTLDADTLIAQMRANEPGKDWRGWCQLAAWYAVRLAGTDRADMVTYGMASDAYRASDIVSMDPGAAPAGAFHYWANPAPEGHVAVALGDGLTLMATGYVGGDGLGTISVEEYTRLSGNPYLGWSYRNGRNRDIRAEFAATTLKAAEPPIEETIIKEEAMRVVRVQETGKCYAISPLGFKHLGSPEQVKAVEAVYDTKLVTLPFGRVWEVMKLTNSIARDGAVASSQQAEDIKRLLADDDKKLSERK